MPKSRKFKLALAGIGETKVEAEALRVALEEERQLRAAAEAAAQELASERAKFAPRPPPAPPAKLKDEIGTVVAIFLRRVYLVRDSLTVLSAEFANRRTLYRALIELEEAKEGRPPNWKKLQGVDTWLERHVSNGQDDFGRAYAKWDGIEKRWEVLISHKGEQARDIVWCRKR